MLVSSKTAEDHLEWCGLVESKVRYLTGNLEHDEHIELAHVNPKRFECHEQQTKTTEFCSMWFVGIQFKQTENMNVNLTENIQNFTYLVYKHGFGLMKNGMGIEVKHLRKKELSAYLGKSISTPGKKSRMMATPTIQPVKSTTANKKRTFSETTTQLQRSEPDQVIKRPRSN